MTRRLLLLLAALTLVAVACAKKGPPPDKDELSAALDDPSVVILDVRTEEEFAGGHVPGAINLHIDRIDRASELIEDKSAPIVVHCAAGVRSAKAKTSLIEQGFETVIDAQTPDTVAKARGVQLEK